MHSVITVRLVLALGLSVGLLSTGVDAQPSGAGPGPGRVEPAEPVEPGEPEAQAGRESPTLIRRIERAAERATAYELEREVAGLLAADGLPAELGEGPVRDALRGVATRCDLLSHSSEDPAALRVLYEVQARVYGALVQDAAAHGESVEVARGLVRLRGAARRLGEVQTGGAAEAGAYWEMLADLVDANRTIADAADRRVVVRELLARYVEGYGDDDEAASPRGYLTDARVALARLLDEAGEQDAAVAALGPLAEAEPGDERYEQVRPVLAHHALVGEQVTLELPAASGGVWRLSDHAGAPVLVHIFALHGGASAGSVAALRQAIARGRQGGFAVVSVHVGKLPADAALPPWPTLVVESDRRGVLDALGVDAVPMYLWVDAQGRVASIGRTTAVVRRFPEPAEEEDAGPVDDGLAPDAEPAAAGDAPADPATR